MSDILFGCILLALGILNLLWAKNRTKTYGLGSDLNYIIPLSGILFFVGGVYILVKSIC